MTKANNSTNNVALGMRKLLVAMGMSGQPRSIVRPAPAGAPADRWSEGGWWGPGLSTGLLDYFL